MDDQVDRTIYVGNLVENVTEEILFELFLQAGPLVNVVIKRPRNSNNKFAFVIFKHSQSVPYAIELFRDTKLYGRVLSIRARMESKHASTENDTTDVTPIDLQHKVLEFITQNAEMNADLQFPDPEPVRRSRSGYNHHNHVDEDSYDPMSNFSLHSTPSYNHQHSNAAATNNDEYDPYEPLIRASSLTRTITQATRHSSLTSLNSLGSGYSVSSNMSRRLGGRMPDNVSDYSSAAQSRGQETYNSFGKRRHVDEEMMPYNSRAHDNRGGFKQRKEMTRNFTLQNPYDNRESVYEERNLDMRPPEPRYQRSSSSQDRSGRQNAYGRRQY